MVQQCLPIVLPFGYAFNRRCIPAVHLLNFRGLISIGRSKRDPFAEKFDVRPTTGSLGILRPSVTTPGLPRAPSASPTPRSPSPSGRSRRRQSGSRSSRSRRRRGSRVALRVKHDRHEVAVTKVRLAPRPVGFAGKDDSAIRPSRHGLADVVSRRTTLGRERHAFKPTGARDMKHET